MDVKARGWHRVGQGVAAAVVGLLAAGVSCAHGSETWYPSRYGPDDELGAINEITPQKVMQARELVSRGKVYDLSVVLAPGTPAFPPRFYEFLLLYHGATSPLGPNRLVYFDEIVNANLGTHTQIDGLGHIGIDGVFYNGHTVSEIARPTGLVKLGIENVPPVVTRGVLVDIAGSKGLSMLPDGYEITVEDIENALRWAGGVRVEPGDVVLFNTGWMSLWGVDNKRYGSGEPGIGLDAARWLIDRRVAMVGADTWAVEVVPSPEGLVFPVHQELIAKNGIYLLENVVTADLAKDRVYEFMLVVTLVKAKGAPQSWATPIALR